MPTVAATVSQVFRYFLPGAFFILLTRISLEAPIAPGTLTGLDSAYLFVSAIVLGSVSYGVHRVLFNPFLHRWVMLAIEIEHGGWYRALCDQCTAPSARPIPRRL